MMKNINMYSKKLPESAMIPVIEEYKADIFPSKNPEIAEEVNSGFGIADVVLFNLDNDTIKKRQRSRLPSIKSYEILETFSVVNALKEPEINITHLYNSLPYSEKVFREKILFFLTSTGVADNIDNTCLKFNYRYESPLKEIVAIEAKVSNWKRGLYQAYRYRQYADFSYLALHSQYIDRAKQNLNLFEDLNVGLIRVDDLKNELELIYKPVQENVSIMNKVRFFACEEILEKKGIIQSCL